MLLSLVDPRRYPAGDINNALIYYATEALKASSDDDHAKWTHALQSAIRQAMEQDNCLLVSVALAMAPSAQHYEILWQALRNVIEIPLQDRYAIIFAVPVVLVVGARREVSLPTCIDSDALNATLCEHDVFTAHSQVFLSGKLLHPDTLVGITPTQLYRYTRQLVDAAQGLPLELEPVPVVCKQEGVFLRYFMGSAIQEPGCIPPVRLGGTVGGWGRKLMALLGEQLKCDGVTLFPIPRVPMPVMQAMVAGQFTRLDVALQVFASTAIRAIRERGQRPVAVMSAHESGDIQFTLFAQDETEHKEKFVWPLSPLDNIALIETHFRRAMAECQVDQIHVIAEVQAD